MLIASLVLLNTVNYSTVVDQSYYNISTILYNQTDYFTLYMRVW